MGNRERTAARLMRGVEHVERKLGGDLSLSEIAASASLSEFHFHRLFRARFGVPVMDYVRRRRIARAAEALLGTREPVLHIALDAGFESQAAFTRAFRKIYHTSPAAFRARGRSVPWLSAAPISRTVEALLPGLGSDQPTRRVIGAFEVAGTEATIDGAGRWRIPQLWRRLAQLVGSEVFAKSDRIGISEGGDAVLEGVLHYAAALRLEPGDVARADLKHRIVPAGTYLVFRCEGDTSEIAAAYDYIFSLWMPRSRHILRRSASFTRLPAAKCGVTEIWIPVENS